MIKKRVLLSCAIIPKKKTMRKLEQTHDTYPLVMMDTNLWFPLISSVQKPHKTKDHIDNQNVISVKDKDIYIYIYIYIEMFRTA